MIACDTGNAAAYGEAVTMHKPEIPPPLS